MTLPIYFSTSTAQRKVIKAANQFNSFVTKAEKAKNRKLKFLIDFPVKVMVPSYFVISILLVLTQIL